ncbi:MAG: 3-dehydroquinate synthase family protein [Thermoanaerobaculia bacterium]
MTAPARFALRHPGGSTPIVVGEGALAAVSDELAGLVRDRRVFVVSTERVLALHRGLLAPELAEATAVTWLEVPEGEAAKTLAEAGRLWDALLELGGKRDSRVIAFGGGSVGDLAGFVAGAFLRGIGVVQVPTTLLAQLDAAIGGKTAIDLPGGKNVVGLFHHPLAVVADTRLLATLPRAELRSGLVEGVKMGVVARPELLDLAERDFDRLLAGDPAAAAPFVAIAGAAKAAIVERDPDESGDRQLLNLGHTLGHALETALGHGTILHGDAVAHGLRFAFLLAERRGADPALGGRVERLLLRLGVPPLPPVSPQIVLEILGRDKKAREAGLTWILPMAAGRCAREPLSAADRLEERLRRFLAA